MIQQLNSLVWPGIATMLQAVVHLLASLLDPMCSRPMLQVLPTLQDHLPTCLLLPLLLWDLPLLLWDLPLEELHPLQVVSVLKDKVGEGACVCWGRGKCCVSKRYEDNRVITCLKPSPKGQNRLTILGGGCDTDGGVIICRV